MPVDILTRIQKAMDGFPGEYAFYAEDQRGNRIECCSDEPWETASCIKVAILLELYRCIAAGELSETEKICYNEENHTTGSGVLRYLTPSLELTLRDMATLMIIISDNVATNVLIDLLGLESINATCSELGLEHTKLLKKIFFSNEEEVTVGQTTPREYSMLFKLIKGDVFGLEASRSMLDILKQQNFTNFFTGHLPVSLVQSKQKGEEPSVQIASKSGSLKTCRNDGGIVFTPWGHYFLTVFTKNFHDPYFYNQHITNTWVPRINHMLYHQFAALQGSFR